MAAAIDNLMHPTRMQHASHDATTGCQPTISRALTPLTKMPSAGCASHYLCANHLDLDRNRWIRLRGIPSTLCRCDPASKAERDGQIQRPQAKVNYWNFRMSSMTVLAVYQGRYVVSSGPGVDSLLYLPPPYASSIPPHFNPTCLDSS